MAVSEDYRCFVMEQLQGLGEMSGRRMFGGYGIYCDGLFFALIDSDVLYLKVDDHNRPAFEDLGQQPFRPYPGKPTSLGYFTVPPEVLEDREQLHEWAQGALAAARRQIRKQRK